jgi:hypothetical protein
MPKNEKVADFTFDHNARIRDIDWHLADVPLGLRNLEYK